jgi:hypothetical protein
MRILQLAGCYFPLVKSKPNQKKSNMHAFIKWFFVSLSSAYLFTNEALLGQSDITSTHIVNANVGVVRL